MIPMAIPIFGGMSVALVTLFVVPLLYASVREWRVRLGELREGARASGEN
jgi:Cu(I)/Ag(I) efflux system membrane protein CusA/SilA